VDITEDLPLGNLIPTLWAGKTDAFILSCVHEHQDWGGFKGFYSMHESLVGKIQVAVEMDTCSLQNCVAYGRVYVKENEVQFLLKFQCVCVVFLETQF
jgi:hypothetical protein